MTKYAHKKEEPTSVVMNKDIKILVYEKSIRISTKNNSLNPLGVVSVMPNIQIALGMDFKEYIGVMSKLNYPVILQKLGSNGIVENWKFIRLGSGEVPESGVAVVTVVNGLVQGVTFNQDLVYDERARKFIRLTAMHQLKAGKVGDIEKNKESAKEAVMAITGEKEVEVISKNKAIVVRVKNVDYIFFEDSKQYYNLLSVRYAK